MVADKLVDMGYAVPDDISIMGVGDYQFRFAKKQRLSHVKVDAKRMAQKAVDLIFEQMDNKAPRRVMLPAVIRECDSVSHAPQAERTEGLV